MSRELKVDTGKLAAEVAWLNRMSTTTPETAVIQVTSLLGAVLLRRTCFDQYRESMLPCEGVGQETILVDATKLAAALKTVSSPITITIDDGKLGIQDSDRIVRLTAAEVEFPKWPRFEGSGMETVSSRELAHVLTSVGTDDTFPQLTVVTFDDGTMVTTDRFRLSAIAYAPSGFTGKVPAALLRAFTKTDTAVFIEAGTCAGETAQWVQLRAGARAVTAAMPDTEFPQWRNLIPSKPPLQVALPRADLLRAATGDEITLTIDNEALTVTSESDGVATEQRIKLYKTVRNTLTGPFTVSIRAGYVAECLREIASSLVLLSGTAPDKPVMFQNVGGSDTHLVMPVKPAPTGQRNAS